jgi:hypothetical protein
MNTGVTGGVPFKSKGSIQSKYNELPMSNMSLNGSSSIITLIQIQTRIIMV